MDSKEHEIELNTLLSNEGEKNKRKSTNTTKMTAVFKCKNNLNLKAN